MLLERGETAVTEVEFADEGLALFLAGLSRHRLLTAAQEVALAKRIERGDRQAKERMVNANLRLVVSIAPRYRHQGVPFLDLIQEGVLGLMRAAEKFDWRRGYRFSTYATWWVREAMQRAVQNQAATIRLPLHVCERRQKLRLATRRFAAAQGREPTRDELAAATGLSAPHIGEALDAVGDPVSLNLSVDQDGGGELGDMLADSTAADPADTAQEHFLAEQSRWLLDELPACERRILELRYGFNGAPQSQALIGKQIGLTPDRVRQLETHALTRLRQLLTTTA